MQNSTDRTGSIFSVGDYSTVRFGAGPVKGHCPKVSTGPKIDQQVTPRRAERFPTDRITRAVSLATSSAKGRATTIVLTVAMPPSVDDLSNTPASQRDMDKAKAAIPMLRIIDIPRCSD
jgi:hypothetical protein